MPMDQSITELTSVEELNRNQVLLRGRLAAAAEPRVLPSGDELVSFRLIVDREGGAGGSSRRRVDTIDCAAWTARTRRSVLAWNAGEVVEIEGALRRRFRRMDGRTVSRVEIEVTRARRVR